jgi:hypothetical protein
LKKKEGNLEKSIEDMTHIRGKGAKIFSIIIISLVSLVLILGSIVSFFNKTDSQSLITIDGKELLTPNMIDAIRSQVSSFPLGTDNNTKLSQILQSLQQPMEGALWEAFALRANIQFTMGDIGNGLKDVYNEQKNAYEKSTNNPFNVSYAQFLQDILGNFNASVIYLNTQPMPIANSLNVSNTYAIDNTLAQVQYSYISLADYLSKTESEKINQYYESLPKKEITSKTLAVLSFPNDKVATQAKNDLTSHKEKLLSAFNSSKTLTLEANKDQDVYLLIQNTQKGELTPVFTYKGKTYLGKVLKEGFAPFNSLSDIRKAEILEEYIKKLPQKERQKKMNEIQNIFTKDPSHALIQKGSTQLFKMIRELPLKDSKTHKAIPFTDKDNLTFNQFAFQKEGYTSAASIYHNIIYKITVLKRQNPQFPLEKATREAISKSITGQEKNYWYTSFHQQIKKEVKININMQNVQKVLIGS